MTVAAEAITGAPGGGLGHRRVVAADARGGGKTRARRTTVLGCAARDARYMQRGARPVPLAPRPAHAPHPSPAFLERVAYLEACRRARAHRRAEMRRPLSERQAERASLAKAELRARKRATAARERRHERTKEAVKTWRFAKSLAKKLMQVAREDEKHVSFAKEAVRDFERQEVRRHSHLLHRCYRCYGQ